MALKSIMRITIPLSIAAVLSMSSVMSLAGVIETHDFYYFPGEDQFNPDDMPYGESSTATTIEDGQPINIPHISVDPANISLLSTVSCAYDYLCSSRMSISASSTQIANIKISPDAPSDIFDAPIPITVSFTGNINTVGGGIALAEGYIQAGAAVDSFRMDQNIPSTVFVQDVDTEISQTLSISMQGYIGFNNQVVISVQATALTYDGILGTTGGINSIEQSFGGSASVDNSAYKTLVAGNSEQRKYITIEYQNSTLQMVSTAPTPTSIVNFCEYFFNGKDGDIWTYVNQSAVQHTHTYEIINTGLNVGRIKVGNASSGIIYESSGDAITMHEIIGEEVLIPPFILPCEITLNQETDSELVVLKLPSLTVQSVSYIDVIVLVSLDKNFAANTMNTTLGLNGITASSVTHVEWYAKGVGLIKSFGVDAATGRNDGVHDEELVSHTVAQLQTPNNNPSTNGGGGGMLNIYLLFILFSFFILVRAYNNLNLYGVKRQHKK